MNKERFFSSIGMIAFTVLAIFNHWVLLGFVLLLIGFGLYEFFRLIKKKKDIPIYSYTGIAIGLLLPISIFFGFELTEKSVFLAFLVFMIFMMQFIRKDNANAIVGISTTLFGVVYVSWFFSFLIKIRFLLPDMGGVKLVAFILIVTKIGDMGALFVGSKFGKHPLLPHVSPSKTVEGSLGSFAASMIAAACVSSFIPAQLNFSLIHIALLGAFFGGLGQLGDMAESIIKRDCGVKDSGKVLPGLGGVLDAIDSLLFSAPAFYFFMSLYL